MRGDIIKCENLVDKHSKEIAQHESQLLNHSDKMNKVPEIEEKLEKLKREFQ